MIFSLLADKGQVTVILDKSIYVNRMNDLLSDSNTYIELIKDPNIKMTTRLNNLVKLWLSLGLIDNYTYKQLR